MNAGAAQAAGAVETPAAPATKRAPGTFGGYMPQLDGLRALAIGATLWTHWAPQRFHFGLPWGAGVTLFFGLSGFLITGLLLDARDAAGDPAAGATWRIWRNFYARRVIRLFPLYYAVLLIVTVVGIVDVQREFAWHLVYASNYYIISQGGWIGYASHFWTLAVEEQFYLVWPLLVLLVPRRRLAIALIAVIATGPLFRLIGAVAWPEMRMLSLATPGQFDALGAGALVAWWVRHPPTAWQWFAARRGAVGFVLLGIVATTVAASPGLYVVVAQTFALSLAFGWAVHGAALGWKGAGGRLLENPLLRYVGRISYGIYLLHNFADVTASFVFHVVPAVAHIPGSWWAIKCLHTFGLAALSWHFFERPINALKRRFPY